MTLRMTRVAIVLGIGASAVACAPAHRSLAATPDAHSTPPVVDTAQPIALAELAGRHWALREWGAGEPFAGKPVVTFRLVDGRVTGRSGCNRYTATAKSGPAAGTIVIGPIAGTRMACPPTIMTIESRFLAALGHVDRWALVASGDLALGYTREDGAAATLLFSEVQAHAATED